MSSHEKKEEVRYKFYEVNRYCECGGRMFSDGLIYTRLPATYRHVCEKCKYEEYLDKIYPYEAKEKISIHPDIDYDFSDYLDNLSKKKRYDLENIEIAFFNHDSDGSEGSNEEWHKRKAEWKSFLSCLNKNKPSKPEQTNQEQKMLMVNGERFTCWCGCNVFHHPDPNDLSLYECNSCEERIQGEKK